MELYTQVFQEAFLAVIWPFRHNVSLFAHHAFGGEGVVSLMLIALIGSICGLLVLMYLGKQFWRLMELNGPKIVKERRAILIEDTRAPAAIAALFICTPFSFIIGIAAGFFEADKHKTIAAGTIGMLCFLSYRLFG